MLLFMAHFNVAKDICSRASVIDVILSPTLIFIYLNNSVLCFSALLINQKKCSNLHCIYL